MNFVKWLVGGFVGASIGGAIWVAVGYFAEAEVGYIALAIGFLAGVGVRAAAGEHESPACGIAGLIAAVAVVGLSKYIVVSIIVNASIGEAMSFGGEVTSEQMIVAIADDIVDEKTSSGETVKWPNGMTQDEAVSEADYPADIWQEAATKYAAIPAEERERQITERKELIESSQELVVGELKEALFKESFGAFDLLWFALAAFTAFRVAAGGADDD